MNELSDANLDAFCVLVEEVSHFHLIVNRAEAKLPVTKLELEWQGEVDKLLLCALLLQKQSGDPHVLPLVRRLFDEALIISDHNRQRYEEATRFAARFWKICGRNSIMLHGALQQFLNEAYRSSWQQKITSITGFELQNAS